MWSQTGIPPGATLQDVVVWLHERYPPTLSSPRVVATLEGEGWERLSPILATGVDERGVIYRSPAGRRGDDGGLLAEGRAGLVRDRERGWSLPETQRDLGLHAPACPLAPHGNQP
jgi:hypothetical protein